MNMRITLAAALTLAACPALATGPYAVSALLPGWSEPGGGQVAGLSIALAPGWKTYWRNPGDAGIPPRFDWSGSENVEGVAVVWPRPHAFDSFGMRTLGYKHEVTLPLMVTPKDPALPVILRLGFDYGVCADICVPAHDTLTLTIAPGAIAPEAASDATSPSDVIAAALANRIQPAHADTMTVERCTIVGAGDARHFEGVFRPSAGFTQAPYVVVEAGDDVWFAPADVRIEDGLIHAAAQMQTMTPGTWVDRATITVTLLGEDEAVAIASCVQ
jgi:DsbC/DsbD-like thiol-disulfide interchange protein